MLQRGEIGPSQAWARYDFDLFREHLVLARRHRVGPVLFHRVRQRLEACHQAQEQPEHASPHETPAFAPSVHPPFRERGVGASTCLFDGGHLVLVRDCPVGMGDVDASHHGRKIRASDERAQQAQGRRDLDIVVQVGLSNLGKSPARLGLRYQHLAVAMEPRAIVGVSFGDSVEAGGVLMVAVLTELNADMVNDLGRQSCQVWKCHISMGERFTWRGVSPQQSTTFMTRLGSANRLTILEGSSRLRPGTYAPCRKAEGVVQTQRPRRGWLDKATSSPRCGAKEARDVAY